MKSNEEFTESFSGCRERVRKRTREIEWSEREGVSEGGKNDTLVNKA